LRGREIDRGVFVLEHNAHRAGAEITKAVKNYERVRVAKIWHGFVMLIGIAVHSLPHLPPVTQHVIGEHASEHGFGYGDAANADARVVAAFGHDVDFFAAARDRPYGR